MSTVVHPLKLARVIRGLSQAELARGAGINRTTVSLLEAGSSPQLHTADRLAAALNLPREVLFPASDREPVA